MGYFVIPPEPQPVDVIDDELLPDPDVEPDDLPPIIEEGAQVPANTTVDDEEAGR
jgi:hypothetical protein